VLTYCYIEQSSQETVAANLALSVRQLRRDQRRAEKSLADFLWAHYGLEAKAQQLNTPHAIPPEAEASSREHELEWLKKTLPQEVAQIKNVIEAALNTLRPLLQASNTQLDCHIVDPTPDVAGQLAALRQALLNLLMAATHAAAGGTVRLSVQPHPPDIYMLVEAIAERARPDATTEVAENLEMARQFIHLFGGELEVLPTTAAGQVFVARLKVPATEQLPVLVIDDNGDTLRLIQRYLANTRYRFIGCPHPDLALDLVMGIAPRLIVLDVMLPGLDDWEMLGRLREHPQTHGVPVIICTILPQEPLALALGAAAFLRKPVSREQLLAKLDQLADSPAKESV